MTNVTLSRPAAAAAASVNPSNAPEFSRTGAPASHAARIAPALAASRSTSSPIAAAGSSPKFESAENRPPMDGMPWNTCLNRSARAIWSNCEPGSVMATKRAAASPPSSVRARARK